MPARTDISSDLAFLDGKRAEMTATLREWCAVNSGSANLAGLAVMRGLIAERFAELGAEIATAATEPQKVVNRQGDLIERETAPALRLVKRPQAPIRILLMGHMDTVFAVDHPFQTERFVDADTLNAPGAADMKGGLLVMLYALLAVERSRFAQSVGYEVLVNADEEIGSPGSARLIEEAAKRAQFALVYEPAAIDGTLAGARKGSGNFAAVVRGRSAHAGRDPHLGRNAVVAAAELASRVATLGDKRPGLTVNVARIDGGGPENVVPDQAVVRFNARAKDKSDASWMLAETNKIVEDIARREGYACALHGGFHRPARPMTPPIESFFKAVRELGAELGLGLRWADTGGVCDGNNVAAAGVPVVDTLGVRGAHIHSADEIARLDSLEERARLSALLILRVAAGDIPNPGLIAERAA